MSTRTPNLVLTKPAQGEVWRSVYNEDLDAIDVAYGTLSSRISDVASEVSDSPEVYILTGTFNGPTGVTIALPKTVSAITEYGTSDAVPNSHAGAIGDIWVIPGTSSLVVYCAENNTTDTFRIAVYYKGTVNAYGNSQYREWIVSPDSSITDHGDVTTEGSLAWVINEVNGDIVNVRLPGNHTYPVLQDLTIPNGINLKPDNGAVISNYQSIAGGGSAWTVVSGSIYSATQAKEPAVLKESGTTLTKVANVGSIDAAGKWCWNAGEVMVRTLGSVDPDTLGAGLLQAWFSITFAVGSHLEDIKGRHLFSGLVSGLDFVRPEWFGAVVNDNTVDSGVKWNEAVDSLVKHGVLQPSPGVYYVSTGILVDEKPITIPGSGTYGTVLKPKSGLADWAAMITVNSTVRGDPANWWATDHDNGMVIRDLMFEGGDRDYLCHGLVFTGKNSDVQLDNLFFSNIKGSGMKACDPFGTTYDDAVTGNLMQQCQFHNIRFQNCGYTATGGTAAENYAASHAAYEIGRNAIGSGSHNHLKHTGVLQIGYSRWRSIRVLNRAGSGETGPNIHELTFQDLFLHGTQSLSGNDENGEAWNTVDHLMTIGNMASSGESSVNTTYNQGEIKTVYIDRYHIVEIEPACSGLVVGECWNRTGDDVGASVHMANGQFGALPYTTPAYGVTFDGAESSYVGGITYHSSGGPANSVQILSLLDSLQEITLGSVSAPVPSEGTEYALTPYITSSIGWDQVHDLTSDTFTVRLPNLGKDTTGDTNGSTGEITGLTSTVYFSVGSKVMISAGFATTGPYTVLDRTATTITVNANSTGVQSNVTITGIVSEFVLIPAIPKYKFVKRAWLVSETGLVSSDTNYATIAIGFLNSSGVDGTGSPVVTTTKTSGSGGTGNWSPFEFVELNCDRGVAYLPSGGTITIEITQTGAGVAVPATVIGFEISDWKYQQDTP